MSWAIVEAVSQAPAAREFSLFWGVLVPAGILLCSVVFTWMLYRHFSKTEQ